MQRLLSGCLEEQQGSQVQRQCRVTALVQLTKEGHTVSQKALSKIQKNYLTVFISILVEELFSKIPSDRLKMIIVTSLFSCPVS